MEVFLSYYPLKQGLKQGYTIVNESRFIEIFILLSIKTRIETSISIRIYKGTGTFLSYYPLKQGLKPMHQLNASITNNVFLSYYPLKQGLKQNQ